MDSNINETLRAEFELLRQEVLARYESTGVKASGKWAKSIRIEELPNGFTLVADAYVNGREPGKAPPSEAIEKWIVQKGIAARLSDNISVNSLAYLIARKIAREGWQPKAGTENLLQQVVTPQRIQQLLNKLIPSHIQDLLYSLKILLHDTV
ncbi:MAG: hypothetical protein ACLGH8_06810 [Bacteroidia bacterium]